MTGSFVLKKFERLIVPCFLWGILYLLAHCVREGSFSLKKIIYLIYGSQAGFLRAGSLTSLWFLPCMFLTTCAFEGIVKLIYPCKRFKLFLVLASIACASIGIIIPRLPVGYPWCLDVSFIAVALMTWGYLAKDWVEMISNKMLVTSILCFACFLLLTLTYEANLSNISINNADLAGRYFGNPFLYLLDALSGSGFIVLSSVLMKHFSLLCRVFTRIGKHTIPILVTHKPIVSIVSSVFERFGVPVVLGVVFGIVAALLFSDVIYLLLRKRLPALFGEGETFQKEKA